LNSSSLGLVRVIFIHSHPSPVGAQLLRKQEQEDAVESVSLVSGRGSAGTQKAWTGWECVANVHVLVLAAIPPISCGCLGFVLVCSDISFSGQEQAIGVV